MRLIVGLGNPGKQYENTRHNLGFRILDLLASGEQWQDKYDSKFIKFEDIILAKPQTFMNKSGEAVKELLKYYPAAELVVIHDDLDIPLGSLKIQKGSSAAGHHGVESIIQELGSKDFIRIRLGIFNPDSRFPARPAGGQIPDSNSYVLQKFTDEEEKILKQALVLAKDAIETLMSDGLETAQSKFNG